MEASENGHAEHVPLLGERRSRQFYELKEDDRKWVRWPMQVAYVSWVVLFSNYVNLLLVFVPLGILSGLLHWGSTPTFVINFLAIIPLAALLSFATEELSAKLGQTLGGLMNATFGNAVELIVSLASSFTLFPELEHQCFVGLSCMVI